MAEMLCFRFIRTSVRIFFCSVSPFDFTDRASVCITTGSEHNLFNLRDSVFRYGGRRIVFVQFEFHTFFYRFTIIVFCFRIENFLKRKVTETIYKNDIYRFNNHIKPYFA